MRKNMQKTILMISVTLMFAIMLSGVVSAADGDVIYVNGSSGNDDNDGYTPLTAKLTIGNATGTVNANGIVNIADGTYTGTGNTGITIDKNMNIIGQSQTGTIIDADHNDYIFYIDSDYTVTLSNLTLRDADSFENYGDLTVIDSTIDSCEGEDGGFVHNENQLTFTRCTFINNEADYGGAIYGCCGQITVKNCTFINNYADTDGGAIYNDDELTVTGSTFTSNEAEDGGAIYNDGAMTINGCTFTSNNADECCGGGAIYNEDELTVTGSTFTGNKATDSDGGAIYNDWGDLTVNYCRIVGNSADGEGNAIYNYDVESSVNAENNWWGSNNPDFDTLISGMPDPTYWLYMTITANPTTINNGETSLITVSFNNLFDGTEVTPLDPDTGHIPDGTPVTFSTDKGSIGCKTIEKETTGGIATATLTADETAGIAHVNAVTDDQTVSTEVTINAKSGLYLKVTSNKDNPVVGDTVVYTLKVGNNGPDTATNVVMTYVVPEGLEFVGAKVDVGEWEYDESTRTITWTIGDVPVGDPYMWITLHIAHEGQYLIDPTLSTSTYDPTLNTDTQALMVNAAAEPTNTGGNTTVNAAGETIPMQNTGLPLTGLVLAVIAVFGGFAMSKRK